MVIGHLKHSFCKLRLFYSLRGVRPLCSLFLSKFCLEEKELSYITLFDFHWVRTLSFNFKKQFTTTQILCPDYYKKMDKYFRKWYVTICVIRSFLVEWLCSHPGCRTWRGPLCLIHWGWEQGFSITSRLYQCFLLCFALLCSVSKRRIYKKMQQNLKWYKNIIFKTTSKSECYSTHNRASGWVE